jgi:hypothetical protein
MNCKPPCLAYITKSDFPELIGLTVEVFAESKVDAKLGFCWRVHASRQVPVWDDKRKRDTVSSDFAVPDAHLRPINGVPVTDDVIDEVTA